MRLDMTIKHNEEFNDFVGQYNGPAKISDLVVEFRSPFVPRFLGCGWRVHTVSLRNVHKKKQKKQAKDQ